MFQIQFIVVPSGVVVRELVDTLDDVFELLGQYPQYESLAIVQNGWLLTYEQMTKISLLTC